jgi:hypothetical protein
MTISCLTSFLQMFPWAKPRGWQTGCSKPAEDREPSQTAARRSHGEAGAAYSLSEEFEGAAGFEVGGYLVG